MSYIQIDNLKYTIRRRQKKGIHLFENLNLSIGQDDFVTLMGGNGTGKTTLTKLMIGMLRPDSGQIILDGKPLSDYKRYEIGRKIGYLFQNPELQLFNGTIKEELLFAYEFGSTISPETLERYDSVLEMLSLNKALKTPIKRLSYGEKQRVAIGTILMNDPQFLILDEPTVGLDLSLKEELVKILIQLHTKGIGIFMVSHDMEFVNQLPTDIIGLRDRRICDEAI